MPDLLCETLKLMRQIAPHKEAAANGCSITWKKR